MSTSADPAAADPGQGPVPGAGPRRRAGPGLPTGFLRLVTGAPEREAIATGQVDAVLDPSTGNVFLLPEAQQALHARQARAASLLALSADWTWEQDENHCFTSQAGTSDRERPPCGALVLGQPLWASVLQTRPDQEWSTHRQQLEWRAVFRDLELGWTNEAGETRWVRLDGEPVYDAQDRFTGYRGTARDITLRVRMRAVAIARRQGETEKPGEPPARPDDAGA